ncbi:T9SS-dependent choice-of-anchor J family protein [Carboxylicivirga linearis]|uniref:Choice-of-anchor J domain-containing protein n=1 Tax=Carboxylicivirga linearis TaxID=1628157 RepID=A0ABS5K355_9BACT|nr:choice-of-anchor J domain-containing protein [Carboxylicivirga linearis]MBS2100886.1 choice-of-anchor J domain-containing protein [Carboxylicivirga linearis]
MVKRRSGNKQKCSNDLVVWLKNFSLILCLLVYGGFNSIVAQQKLPAKRENKPTHSFGVVDKSAKVNNEINKNPALTTDTVTRSDSNIQIKNKYQAKLTKSDKLRKLSVSFANKYENRKAEAYKLAKEKGWVIRSENNGNLMELQGLDDNNRPIYYITNNEGAAKTTSTDQLYDGGLLGLSLDGSGIHAGVWDGGGVLTTHQEFNNTGAPRVTQKDNPSSTNYHATHVAGTMVAGGVVQKAKGMAYNGELNAYDWDSDISEMAAEAAKGLLISNHSYGYVLGWSTDGYDWTWYGDPTISALEDYNFGFYSSAARNFDEVALNAPYYLIVKSAGNDRGQGPTNGSYPQDGPYDCIGTQSTAKNILTIGAVEELSNGYQGDPSEVIMSSFSAWGPVDDGRIKPDIVTKGVDTYSTYDTDNTAYNTISGTSMASPSAAGSLMLLQQHYHNLNNEYMKSATLKALAIHTADECGPNPGPDYMFGWGLLNSAAAATTINKNNTQALIQERSYDGTPQTLTVKASGTEPIIVTMVWTDLPGTPVSPQLDPADPMLVNDLDVKISSDGEFFYPYKLDRDNPEAAATTGINSIDNVEKIVIDNPIVGQEYTITISHKGLIEDGAQDYSLIVTGIVMDGVHTATFTVADADGIIEGATVNVGGLQRITDENGEVTFVVLDNTTYSYTVTMYGYYDQTGSIAVSGEDLMQSIKLLPLPSYDVTFNVVSKQTGNPIENALIEFDNTSILTNSSGIGIVHKIIDGDHSYTISANEFAAVSGTITMRGADQTLNFELEDTPVLWDNFSTEGTSNGIISANYGGLGEFPNGLIESADDFIVPVGAIWNDIDIYAYGFSQDVYPQSFYLIIYSDNKGRPGEIVFHDIIYPANVKNPVFPLNNLGLNSGKYWLSVAGNFPDAVELDDGRWNMSTILDTKNEEALLRDHPDLFNTGTDWSLTADLLEETTVSLKFAIYKPEVRYPVSLTLVDQYNQVVNDVTIVFEDGRKVVSDNNGKAQIFLPEGDHNYTINSKGYDGYSGSINISGPVDNQLITLNKQPQYNVVFTVKNTDGNVIANAGIYLPEEDITLQTDANGVATVSLLPGNYSYTVSFMEYASYSDSFTIIDTDLNKNVQLTYNGVLFFESFENSISDWTLVDADGDGYYWEVKSLGTVAIDGSKLITSESYSIGALTPENWLISPEIDLSEKSGIYKLEYYVGAQDENYPLEHYKCIVSTTGNTVDDFSNDNILLEETLSSGFGIRTVDLTPYVGSKIHIAWVHYDCTDQYRINLDAIKVFKNISKDACIVSIDSPNNQNSCSLGDSEVISAMVANYGGYDITSLTMRYSINGDTPVEEVFDNVLIAPGDHQVIEFTQTADLSILGRYEITVECEINNETVTDNNQQTITVDNGDAVITVRAYSGSGSDNRWTIKDENGTVVKEYSDYPLNTQKDIDVCIQSYNCYTFEFNGFKQSDGVTPSETAWLEILYNGDVIWGGVSPGNAGESVKVQYIGDCSNFELYTVGFKVAFGIEPIAGATIAINESTYTTEENGKAIITIPNGQYDYSISADRYSTKSGHTFIDGMNVRIREELLLDQEIFFESFEGDISDWINTDGDGDGFKWGIQELEEGEAIDGNSCISSKSWDSESGTLTPENWLISPEIDLSQLSTASLSYYIGPGDAKYPQEHYKCVVSTNGTDISNFTDDNIIYEETIEAGDIALNFKQRTIDLSSYIGQKIRIAWVHYDCKDIYTINLDAVSVRTSISSDETISTNLLVTDENNNAIQNVQVEVNGLTGITDINGKVTFTQLVEGMSYEYSAAADIGYEYKNGRFVATAVEPVQLVLDVVQPVNFSLNNSYYQPDVELSWVNDATQKWFKFDSGVLKTGIGTNSEAVFDAAIQLDQDDFTNYDGFAITQFAFTPYIDSESLDAEYTMHIWDEDGNDMYSQLIDSYEANSLNIVELNTPYVIDVDKAIYIGYRVVTPGGYPIGCDEGPAIANKTDLLNLGDGFVSASINYGVDYNWIIRAYATSNSQVNSVGVQSVVLGDNTKNNFVDQPIQSIKLESPITIDKPILKSSSGFTYNIYRNNEVIANITTTNYDEVINPGVYTYYVTSVYNGAESSPSDIKQAAYVGDKTTDRKTVLLESVINTEMNNSAGIEKGLNDLLIQGYSVSNINYCIGDAYENDFSIARVEDYYAENQLAVRVDGVTRIGGSATTSLVDTYKEAYLTRLAQKSIIEMNLELQRQEYGKCIATVDLHELFKLHESGYVLYLALVENNIDFTWAEPATINSILKSMYPDASGTPFEFIDGTANVKVEFDVDKNIDIANFKLIAFVQHSPTHDVMQAVNATLPVGTSIDMETNPNTIQIYPNPVSNLLNIDNISIESEVLIQISNSAGRVIRRVVIPVGLGTAQIDFSGLPKGVYFINLISEEQSIGFEKVVKW